MSSNFKHQSLGLLLLVSAVAINATAAPSSNERITQLERIASAQGQAVTQLQQQLFSVQRDIDDMRGLLETTQHQLGKLQENQRQLYLQLEQMTSASTVQSKEESRNRSVTTATSGQNEELDYKNALALALEKKETDKAITAFQTFLKDFPKSQKYSANANYWLGQLYYNKGDKESSSHYFAIVVKNYANSPKVEDAMYKVAVIMEEKGDVDKAKAIYQQVIKLYPGSTTANRADARLKKL